MFLYSIIDCYYKDVKIVSTSITESIYSLKKIAYTTFNENIKLNVFI